MTRWIALSLLLVPLMASAADFWDGNAALQRGDASFEGGLFVESNSFPPGTQITLQNEDTGKMVTATVTGRIEGQSDILVLVSPKTADALGLSQGQLGRVRVTKPPAVDAAAAAQPGDQPVSSDPDVNPAASSAPATTAAAPAASEAPAAEAPASTPEPTPATAPETPGETATAQQPPAEQPAGEQPAGEQPASEQPPATAEQPVAAPPVVSETPATPGTNADDQAILSDAQSRAPQKEVFQPPREDKKFALQPATTPPATTTAQTGAEGPTITSVTGEPGVTPASKPPESYALADVAAPEEARPQEIVSTGAAVPPAPAPAPQVALASPDLAPQSAAPSQEPVRTEVTGPAAVPPAGKAAPKLALTPPETPKPAGSGPAATTPATRPAANVTSTTTLPRTGSSTFYLQLAAFGTERVARDLVAKLASTYPALVLAPNGTGASVFKVVIGPLNKAESGTLLTWFRCRGFPDAFLKQEQ